MNNGQLEEFLLKTYLLQEQQKLESIQQQQQQFNEHQQQQMEQQKQVQKEQLQQQMQHECWMESIKMKSPSPNVPPLLIPVSSLSSFNQNQNRLNGTSNSSNSSLRSTPILSSTPQSTVASPRTTIGVSRPPPQQLATAAATIAQPSFHPHQNQIHALQCPASSASSNSVAATRPTASQQRVTVASMTSATRAQPRFYHQNASRCNPNVPSGAGQLDQHQQQQQPTNGIIAEVKANGNVTPLELQRQFMLQRKIHQKIVAERQRSQASQAQQQLHHLQQLKLQKPAELLQSQKPESALPQPKRSQQQGQQQQFQQQFQQLKRIKQEPVQPTQNNQHQQDQKQLFLREQEIRLQQLQQQQRLFLEEQNQRKRQQTALQQPEQPSQFVKQLQLLQNQLQQRSPPVSSQQESALAKCLNSPMGSNSVIKSTMFPQQTNSINHNSNDNNGIQNGIVNNNINNKIRQTQPQLQKLQQPQKVVSIDESLKKAFEELLSTAGRSKPVSQQADANTTVKSESDSIRQLQQQREDFSQQRHSSPLPKPTPIHQQYQQLMNHMPAQQIRANRAYHSSVSESSSSFANSCKQNSTLATQQPPATLNYNLADGSLFQVGECFGPPVPSAVMSSNISSGDRDTSNLSHHSSSQSQPSSSPLSQPGGSGGQFQESHNKKRSNTTPPETLLGLLASSSKQPRIEQSARIILPRTQAQHEATASSPKVQQQQMNPPTGIFQITPQQFLVMQQLLRQKQHQTTAETAMPNVSQSPSLPCASPAEGGQQDVSVKTAKIVEIVDLTSEDDKSHSPLVTIKSEVRESFDENKGTLLIAEEPSTVDQLKPYPVLITVTKQSTESPPTPSVEFPRTVVVRVPSDGSSNTVPQPLPPSSTTPIRTPTPSSTGGPATKSGTISDEDEYVDVVGDGTGRDGSGGTSFTKFQRRAHIEFYRKLKAFRTRESRLECHLCQEVIHNSDASIRSHIHQHCPNTLFVCKLCQQGFQEQHQIFEHISNEHPKMKDCHFFEDRRDMCQLSELLANCFPRGGTKCRDIFNELLDRLLHAACKERIDTFECQLCDRNVPTQKNSLIKHLQVHPSYRCKTCKFTCSDEGETLRHCQIEHNYKSNECQNNNTIGYHVCSALEVLSSILKRCFVNRYAPNVAATLPGEECPSPSGTSSQHNTALIIRKASAVRLTPRPRKGTISQKSKDENGINNNDYNETAPTAKSA